MGAPAKLWRQFERVTARRQQIAKEDAALRDRQNELRQLLAAELRMGSPVPLTTREREVLTVMQSEPLPANKEIADRLNISERTVKFHVGTLLAKFGAIDRRELVMKANREKKP